MFKQSKPRIARIVAGSACLAALAGGSVALARGGASGKASIESHQVGSAIAKCPRRTGVIAGGFSTPKFSPGDNGSSAARIGSQRVGKRKLKTTAFNFGDQTAVIRSLAYCSRAGLRVRVASQKVFVAPQSADVAIATCPGTSRAVGGGFATPGFNPGGAPRVLTLTSKRVAPSQWRVEAYNINDGGSSSDPRPGTLIAYAYCLDDAPRIVTRSKRTPASVQGKTRTAKVRCPRRMKALSGGFDGNIVLSANPTGAGAIASRRAAHGRAWRTTALSISEHKAKVTTIAYCIAAHR